jgi:hypothetical protein
MGGLGLGAGGRAFTLPVVGDVGYLWVLVALEMGTIAWLRNYFRRYHGG